MGKMVEHPKNYQPNPGLRADESPCIEQRIKQATSVTGLHSAAVALERALAVHRGGGGDADAAGRPHRPRPAPQLRRHLSRARTRHFRVHR